MNRLLVSFNTQYDRIQQSYYARSVAYPLAPASVGVSWFGGSGPQPKLMQATKKKKQIQRTNRVSDSPNPFLPSWGES